MSININVQPGDGDVWASARKFDSSGSADGFVTFEVGDLGKGSVTLFLRTIEDARKVMDAALEAFRLTSELETAKVVAKAKADAVAAAATAIEESYNPFEDVVDSDYEYFCDCNLCMDN